MEHREGKHPHDMSATPETKAVKEYSFEEGVAEIAARTERMLVKKDQVLIGIIGSGAHVGKTFLCRALQHRLQGQIPFMWQNNVRDYRDGERESLETQKEFRQLQKEIIVVGQAYFPNPFQPDVNVRDLANELLALEASPDFFQEKPAAYDMLVAISRTDKPFPDNNRVQSLVDVFIINDASVDKKPV